MKFSLFLPLFRLFSSYLFPSFTFNLGNGFFQSKVMVIITSFNMRFAVTIVRLTFGGIWGDRLLLMRSLAKLKM